MPNWFTRSTKITTPSGSGRTSNTRGSKGTTFSTSFGSKSMRITTTTKPGGKTVRTGTTRFGGSVKRGKP
jgi:hypothetical protein